MQNAFSCPIDQLHIGGYLACDVSDARLKERLADIRYITAKRLKACDVSEFNKVSLNFKIQKDLVYQVVKGKSLPTSLEKWIPAFCDSLDSAAIYWEIKCDEEIDNFSCFDSWGVGVLPLAEPDDMERHAVNSRGPVYENVSTH